MTTPLMGLDIPTPGATGTKGPDYAIDLAAAFDVLDSHDHAPGNGPQIGVAGLSIDADLGVGAFNIQNVRSVRLNDQTAALDDANDLRNLYAVNGDLFFNDGAANQIRLTASGALNAASIGGIGGDYASSNASVSYSDTTKVFSFTQDSGITAKMAFGDILLSENVVSAPAITIKSPAALGGAYSLTLFAGLPADDLGTNVVAVSAAGVFSTTQTTIMVTPQIRDTSKDHSYIFAVNELTANRTVTMPLLIGDDTFVFEDHIQTLVGKTLTTPVLTAPTINAATITGAVTHSGTIDQTNTTDATSPTTGATKTAGGIGIAKALWVGGLANIAGAVTLQSPLIGDDATDSTNPTSGAFQTDGGLGVAKALWVGGLADIAGAVNLQASLAVGTLLTVGTTLGVTGIATFTAAATMDAGVVFDDQGATPSTPAAGDAHLYQRANNARVTKLSGGDLSTALFWEDEQGLVNRAGAGYIELDDADHDWSAVAAPEVPLTAIINPATIDRTIDLFTLLVPIGWEFELHNTNTAQDVFLRPSGKAETYTVGPGEWIRVKAIAKAPTTGMQWRKVAGSAKRSAFTGDGTFTVPAFVHRVHAIVTGGGGGGEGSVNTTNGAGTQGCAGGAAGSSLGYLAVTAGDADSVTVGAAGTAGAANGGNGGNGGNSSFKALTGNGGEGGVSGSGGDGGGASGGDVNVSGGDGSDRSVVDAAIASAVWQSSGPKGGESFWGGGGGGKFSAAGRAGQAPGSGGAGGGGDNTANTDDAGGAGAAGLVVIDY